MGMKGFIFHADVNYGAESESMPGLLRSSDKLEKVAHCPEFSLYGIYLLNVTGDCL